MPNPHFLIIGQGSIGLQVSNVLVRRGHNVTGMARGMREEYGLDTHVKFIQADALTLTAEQIIDFTHIAIIVSPDNYNSEAYKQTYFAIAQHVASLEKSLPNIARIVFISSTGVYGQDNGEWIDETVEPEPPKREASTYILQAEQVLQEAFSERTIIIRPSGIYGNKRLMRVRKAQEKNKEPMPQYAWTNRIMDSDLVNIIVNVLVESDNSRLKRLYLATDYAPVTSYELTCWLSKQLHSTMPDTLPPLMPATLLETSNPKEDGSSRNFSGKRLVSNIPRDWLAYPDWQVGYTSVLKHLK